MKRNLLTKPQVRALLVAAAHQGAVVVARAYGRDKNTANAIHRRVYVQLVGAGLLTPYQCRSRFIGEMIHVEAGKAGYLTPFGEKVVAEIRARGAA